MLKTPSVSTSAPGARAASCALQRGGVAVRIVVDRGARDAARVDQRGVVEAVAEDRAAFPDERRREPEVCHVAGREEQRALAAGEFREFLFERVVLALVTRDEVRGARADAVQARRLDERLGHARMRGEAEVVVAAEIDAARRRRARSRRCRARVAGRCGAGGGGPARRDPRARPRKRSARPARDQPPGDGRLGPDAEPAEERVVALGVGIAGRQELLAVEDRVRAGEEAERLHFVAHLQRGPRRGAHASAASGSARSR